MPATDMIVRKTIATIPRVTMLVTQISINQPTRISHVLLVE
jgi:hypothetical protein